MMQQHKRHCADPTGKPAAAPTAIDKPEEEQWSDTRSNASDDSDSDSPPLRPEQHAVKRRPRKRFVRKEGSRRQILTTSTGEELFDVILSEEEAHVSVTIYGYDFNESFLVELSRRNDAALRAFFSFLTPQVLGRLLVADVTMDVVDALRLQRAIRRDYDEAPFEARNDWAETFWAAVVTVARSGFKRPADDEVSSRPLPQPVAKRDGEVQSPNNVLNNLMESMTFKPT